MAAPQLGSREASELLLHRFFGHGSFRPSQWDVISALDRSEDCVVLMATGSGKSLLYQFLSIARRAVAAGGDEAAFAARRGTTLVVSPLLSLARDQVMHLEQTSVRATMINSLQQDASVWRDAAEGAYDVLFSTPETVLKWLPQLRGLADRGLLDLIAIDEGARAGEGREGGAEQGVLEGTLRQEGPPHLRYC